MYVITSESPVMFVLARYEPEIPSQYQDPKRLPCASTMAVEMYDHSSALFVLRFLRRPGVPHGTAFVEKGERAKKRSIGW
jgi:hypothetical protein